MEVYDQVCINDIWPFLIIGFLLVVFYKPLGNLNLKYAQWISKSPLSVFAYGNPTSAWVKYFPLIFGAIIFVDSLISLLALLYFNDGACWVYLSNFSI